MAANEYNLLEPLFLYLAEQTGFLVDQIRYIVLMFMSYPLALILRYVLHPDHAPVYVRHLYSLLVGVVMGLFCFGWGQMGILFFIIAVSYFLLIFLPPAYTQRYSMLWAMGSIAMAHVYRVATDYGGFHLDFTGPLMIMVQKITLTAYALHDGVAREDSQLNKDQRQQKLLSPLGPLEYLSYMFNFHSLLAGPSCTAKEHLSFMDGSNLRPSPSGGKPKGEPSATFPIFSKLFQALASVAMFVVFTWYIDNDLVMEPHHRHPFRLLLNYINSLRVRGRYYFIWLLAESINNCAGLGFAGYDEQGQPKWDLISNINIWQIESATNLRVIAMYWNAVTGLWLRRCVYERVLYAKTLATFAVSAWWHGCYPGYYFCFIYFGIATEAARKMRRLLHHHFQGSAGLRVGYDMTTWLVTHLYLDYGVLCLDMMWASKSITYWSYYYFIPIITVTVVAVLFPTGKTHRSKVKAEAEKPQEPAGLINPKIKPE